MKLALLLSCSLQFALVAQNCLGQIAQEPNAGTLDQVLPLFDLHDDPMLGAAHKLRQAGVQICFEEVQLNPVRDRLFDQNGTPVGVRKKTFSLHLANRTIRSILDDLVTVDSEYVWEGPTMQGQVMILPRAGSVLNWNLNLKLSNEPRIDAIQTKLLLRQHHVSMFWRGSYENYNTEVNQDFENRSIKEILNELVSAGPKLCWTLAGFEGQRILSFESC